jgi:hypothetical protein
MQASGRNPRVVLGAVVSPVMLTRGFTGIFADSPLLPRALIGEAASRDVFAVQVVDAGGREVFAIGGDRSAYAGTASLPERLGQLAVHASIHADRASSLVIGGLPARRWPQFFFYL